MADRRQRKKKHLAEFQEFGFEFEAQLRAKLSVADWECFADAFLAEAIECRDRECGGGGNEAFGGFFASAKRYGRVDDSHRKAVRVRLEKHPMVSVVNLGPLRDAWYGWS